MHHITRKTAQLLNSAESHLFITSPPRLNLTVRPSSLSRQTTPSLPPPKPKFNHHSSFPHRRRHPNPPPPAMDSDSHSPEPESVVAAVDDVTVIPNSLGIASADENDITDKNSGKFPVDSDSPSPEPETDDVTVGRNSPGVVPADGEFNDRDSGEVQVNQDAVEFDLKSDLKSPEADAMIEDVGDSSCSIQAEGGEVFVEERGGGNENIEGEESVVNPEEVLRNVMRLSCESLAEGGVCDVYMVGTAHVSTESCKEVQAVISLLKPQVVFLELCSGRVALLSPQNIKVPTMGEMVNMWKKNHNMFGILYSSFLAKVASRLDVFPGSEFRVAYEEAMKYGGKVVLGDRPVSITLKRTWAKMPLWHRTKLLYSLVFQTIFLPSPEDITKALKEMDDADMLTIVIQEMSKKYPTLMETLVLERDQYMSSRLLKVASEHSSVVAVVGKGHLQGIKKHWKQPVAVNDLLEIPSKSPVISAMKVVTMTGVAVAGVAIVSGIYLSCRK